MGLFKVTAVSISCPPPSDKGCVSSPCHSAAIYHDLVAGGDVDCELGQKPGKQEPGETEGDRSNRGALPRLHSLQAIARVRWIGKMGLAGQMRTWRPSSGLLSLTRV